MTFTDSDMKRLKEDGAKYGYQLCKPDGLILDLWALLARLEAAEKAAEDTGSPELYKAWRKSKGDVS
jgi:hypothetical protein